MAKLGYVYLCRTVPQRMFSMPCLRNFHELAAGQIERLTTGQITAGQGARMASRLSQARLHAKLQYLPAGDRRANSDPATLAGELTRFPCCEPMSSARFDRSGPPRWPEALPLQMIATFRMLHLCWLGVGTAKEST